MRSSTTWPVLMGPLCMPASMGAISTRRPATKKRCQGQSVRRARSRRARMARLARASHSAPPVRAASVVLLVRGWCSPLLATPTSRSPTPPTRSPRASPERSRGVLWILDWDSVPDPTTLPRASPDHSVDPVNSTLVTLIHIINEHVGEYRLYLWK